ncbi:MAG TPA: HEAT repeat domain-containing protein [Verrucomicrobiae bacterium]
MEHSKRWSAPELLMIREMGEAGVDHLRRVIREKDSLRTRVLLRVGGTWAGAISYIPNYPDLNKMRERLTTACQVIHTLGPAARRAMPELVAAMEKGGIGEANSVSMALNAIGVDAEMVQLLLPVLEGGAAESPRMQMIRMLARVKPPSERTTKYLTSALKDPSPHVQQAAVSAVEQLVLSNPEVIAELKNLRRTGPLNSLQVEACSALWQLTKEREEVLETTFALVESELRSYGGHQWPGSGGQGIDGTEQTICRTGDLWARMNLESSEREKALGLLKDFCKKSGRVFIRLLLLPSMMELGLGMGEGQLFCRQGMFSPEDYYHIHGARLLAQLSERGAVDAKGVEEMLASAQVGVRVYGAKVHWKVNRKVEVALPILIEALDQKKHQSYYYPEIQRAALTTLREMGPEGAPAKEKLQELRSDPNPEVVKLVYEIVK